MTNDGRPKESKLNSSSTSILEQKLQQLETELSHYKQKPTPQQPTPIPSSSSEIAAPVSGFLTPSPQSLFSSSPIIRNGSPLSALQSINAIFRENNQFNLVSQLLHAFAPNAHFQI